jgi:hypothetical protein
MDWRYSVGWGDRVAPAALRVIHSMDYSYRNRTPGALAAIEEYNPGF